MNSIQPIQTESNLALKKAVDVQDKTMVPAYVWKTGRTFFLNKKEKIVADAWLSTFSYRECARALNKEGFTKNWLTCLRWLRKPHVVEYLEEQIEERGVASGWTEEHWLKVMTDHVMGVKRLQGRDLYAMKLIASVKRFEAVPEFNFNQQINFTQADGRA